MERVRIGEVELAVTDAGSGDPALVLVHGYTGAKEDFADHVDLLASDRRVVAYDHRGHGESSRAPRYSIDLLVDDLVALANTLGLERFVLLGHSMGGFVAQRFAWRHPERLSGLVLMDTGPGPLRMDGPRRQLIEAAGRIAMEQGMEALVSAQKALGQDPLATQADARVRGERPGYAEFGERKLLATDPKAYAQLMADMLGQDDGRKKLGLIGARTLVLVGEQDVPFRRAAEVLEAGIADSELVVLAGAGHSPQFEAPDAWLAALEAFLGRMPPGR